MIRKFLFLFLFLSASAHAEDRLVTNFADDGNGTLRKLIVASCYFPGDDTITFAPTYPYNPQIIISLTKPLVMEAGCHGTITIIGPEDREVILEGSAIVTGDATLNISSWGNEVDNLIFVGNQAGPAILLKNSDNLIQNNFIGVYRNEEGSSPNKIGIRVSGDWNILRNNTISANLSDGVIIDRDANSLEGNRIGDRKDSCSDVSLPYEEAGDFSFVREIVHPFINGNGPMLSGAAAAPLLNFNIRENQSEECGNGGAGIRISGDRNLIGNNGPDDPNRILFNEDGGIVVEPAGLQNKYFNNVIAYNNGPGIVLKPGANNKVESLKSIQSFPVNVEPADGIFRYTLWGSGQMGTTVDLYLVASDEPNDSQGQGEGAKYLESFIMPADIFTRSLQRNDVPPGSRVSAVVCDKGGNCSGFSQNVVFGRDADHDGMVDPSEDSNSDLVVQKRETDPLLMDTDGDGLPDPVEDRNQNGLVDPGETDPSEVDSDGDGLNDFIETGGDGTYDVSEGDTDPNNPDTDGDGLLDGDEDKNHDGVIQLGENNPRKADTDGDSQPDQ